MGHADDSVTPWTADPNPHVVQKPAIWLDEAMALITEFEKVPARNGRRQTTTKCEWFVTSRDDETVLQLDTGGSDERQNPGKPSQTLQLNMAGAGRLIEVLMFAFPELKPSSR